MDFYLSFLAWSAAFLCLIILSKIYTKPKSKFRPIPVVSGSLPLLGHAVSLLTQGVAPFFLSCYRKYGPIFSIRLFSRSYVYICERELTEEYFRASESDFSLYYLVRQLCFMDSFFSKELLLSKTFGLFKQGVNSAPAQFLPEMREEAVKLVERLKKGNPREVEFTPREARRYIMSSVMSSFLGIQLEEQMFSEVDEIMSWFNGIISVSSFLPRRLLQVATGWKLRRLSANFMRELDAQVQLYREDESKADSKLLRICATYINPDLGRPLNPAEISGLALLVLFSSTANTSIGLYNILSDLSCCKEWTTRVRHEIRGQDDLKALVTGKELDAVVNETLRLTTGFFAITRIPRNRKELLGWDLGGVDGLSICAPLLHVHSKSALQVYKEPEEWEPERFVGRGEPTNTPHLLSWGVGLHSCPAKAYATFAMKIAVAEILKEFEVRVEGGKEYKMQELDYFAASSFAQRKGKLWLKNRIED